MTDLRLKHSPAMIGCSNLLIYGLGYLLLNMYRRFFLSWLILLVVGNLLGFFGLIACYIIVGIDSFKQATDIQKGKQGLPAADALWTILAVAFIVMMAIFAILSMIYL